MVPEHTVAEGWHTNGAPIGCSSDQTVSEFLLQIPGHAVQFILPATQRQAEIILVTLHPDGVSPRGTPKGSIYPPQGSRRAP